MLPNGQGFGVGAAGVILQSEKAVTGNDASLARGTLKEWQDNVARLAVGNHRIALIMSAAFAGTLLYIAGEPSGGLHLFGKSQDGKSTILFVATSIWGKGDTTGAVRLWRATANGMEGVAAETCDAFLPLDEIGMVDAREVGEIVYALANESGKARANRDGSARARRTWRTVFASTGEVPLAAKMAEKGSRPMAGQDIRLVSLPADAGADLGVFQNLHDATGPAEFAVQLREASRTYYGTAAPAFLAELTRALAQDRERLMAFLTASRQEFLAANVPAGADGQVISVARRFALYAIAGELGIAFKILPWPKGEATRAAASGFWAWLEARGGIQAGEDVVAIAQVRRFIELHGESRFTTIVPNGALKDGDEVADSRNTINRVGFRRRSGNGDGGWEYLSFPEAFKDEVCKGLDHVRAANVLKAKGCLASGEGRHLQKYATIAGYGRKRFYIINSAILDGDE